MAKYWELEEPVIKKSEKNVVKVFAEQGKLQVFPRVNNSKYGIGRGVTLDLEDFQLDELKELQSLIKHALEHQIEKKKGLLI